METAVERWDALLQARAQQMDAAYARLGRTSADFWDRRARGFHRTTRDTIARDSFFSRLRREVTPLTTVLDVGAGTGRFALALAPLVEHITAVEPNAAMLDYLRQDMSEQGLNNITIVQTTWEDAPGDLTADIVIYIHALDALFEMGIYADVEIVKLPVSMRFPSLDIAVDEQLEQLILPADEQTSTQLRQLLEGWLVERDGMLVPPVEEMVCAIIKIPSSMSL